MPLIKCVVNFDFITTKQNFKNDISDLGSVLVSPVSSLLDSEFAGARTLIR